MDGVATKRGGFVCIFVAFAQAGGQCLLRTLHLAKD